MDFDKSAGATQSFLYMNELNGVLGKLKEDNTSRVEVA